MYESLKGQVSIEFLSSFFLYILAVVAVFQFVSGDIPDFQESLEEKKLHFEAKYVSDQLLKESGYHTVGDGGSNWEKNSSTMNSVESLGLASEYMIIDHDKLEQLSTVSQSKINYTQFREKVGVDNQYHLNFTWTPVVITSQNFNKGNAPPEISATPSHSDYDSAGKKVNYGNVTLNGETKHFLVTSHRGQYNTTYVSSDTNFQASNPRGVNAMISFGGRDFKITGFQNVRYERGGQVFLESHLKEFGSTIDRDQEVVKFNRYPSYRDENSELMPARVEVFAW